MIQTIGETLKINFNSFGATDYDLFLRCKRLPESKVFYDYERDNYTIETHARYANLLGVDAPPTAAAGMLDLPAFLFEHQCEIVKLALAAKTFAVWSDCGTGKTLIELEFARQVAAVTGGRVLILTYSEIARQTVAECRKFYGEDLPILLIESKEQMRRWCEFGDGVHSVAITNYEKTNPDENGQIIREFKFLDGLILDESSRLKAGGGKQKWAIIKSSKGIPYKLSCTATPAPNDVIEFASQASFLERMRSENEIIWTFFSRDKITQEWTVKRHAKEAFFEWMSAWSIYLRDARRYGWSATIELPPDPVFLRHEIAVTAPQVAAARAWNVTQKGQVALFASQEQGIVGRSKLSQIAKGFVYEKDKSVTRIESNKPRIVAEIIEEEIFFNNLQVLCWTVFDSETEIIAESLQLDKSKFAVLTGKTKPEQRIEILEKFRAGEIECLISNAKLLGYGMNFQNVGSMVFSGWNDSFEEFYQAVRRAVRFGQTRAVRIHLPFVPELELAQLDNIFRKEAKFIESIEAQEAAYIKAMKRLEIL